MLRYRKFLRVTFGCAIAAFCNVTALAQSSSFEKFEKLNVQIVSLQSQKDLYQSKLQVTSRKISDVKKELRTSSSLFKQYKLDSLLKEAQELANHVVLTTKNQLELQNQLSLEKLRLLDWLDQQLVSAQIKVRDKNLSLDERQEAYAMMLSHMSKRDKFLPSFTPTETKSISADRMSKMIAQVDQKEILLVLKRDIKMEIAALSVQVAALQKQNFIRSELESFLEEESFFSESGFVRTTTSSAKATKDEKLAKGEPSASATPGDANVTASAVPQKVETSDTSTAKLGNSDKASPTDLTPVAQAWVPLSIQANPDKSLPSVRAIAGGNVELSKSSAALTNTQSVSTVTAPNITKESSTHKVDVRDRIGSFSQDLSKNALRKKSMMNYSSGNAHEAKGKPLQYRLDFLKAFLQELELEQERLRANPRS